LGPAEDSARAAQALDTLSLPIFGQIRFAVPPGRSSLEFTEQVFMAAGDPRMPAPARASALEYLSHEYLRHGRIGDWVAVDLRMLTMARLVGLLADPEAIALQEQLAARESYPQAADYLAMLYAQQGRYAEAQAAVDWLEGAADSLEVDSDSTRARAFRGLALVYSGHIAAAREDATAAIGQLRQGLALMPGNWNAPRNAHRFVLANLIEDSDELEALRIYGSLYYSPWLEAFGYLRRAQLHERRGEREDALRYYGWFLELWEDADAHLQPQVESARRSVDRLAGEGVAD
jgi:tetratricopeptide (TPR) repeat protein